MAADEAGRTGHQDWPSRQETAVSRVERDGIQ
jgi:hypothetical protein